MSLKSVFQSVFPNAPLPGRSLPHTVRQAQGGFQLLELLVTLVVAGIIAAIAIPNFLNWLPDIRLKSAARDLFSHMQSARMEAIKENKNIRIQFDNSVSPGFYYFDLDEDGIPDPGEFRRDLADYKNGVDFGRPPAESGSAITFPNNLAEFNAKGLLNNSVGGYVYLRNRKSTSYYRVGALKSGAIRIQRREGGQWN